MKTIWKKNQFILTVLAVVIAVAGYLTYTGETGTLLDAATTGDDQAVQGDALMDISEEDILAENMALENAAAETGQGEGGDAGDSQPEIGRASCRERV